MTNYNDYKNAYKKSGQNAAGMYTKAEWDNKSSAAQKTTMAGLKALASPKPTSTPNISDSTGALDMESANILKSIVTLLHTKVSLEEKNNEIMSLSVDFLKKEGIIRKRIVQDLGQIGIAQEHTTQLIADASVEAALYGVEYTKILDTVSELSNVIGRNVGLTDKDVTRAALFSEAMNVSSYSVSQMVKQFDMMNINISDAIDKGNEMAHVARNMGVNMQGFMEIINRNMDMLNTYNFADGVKGFAKMAAQSQRLGFEMSKTKQWANDLMDPEGAIELAANLQVIGGAVGELADPFKMMYMATNDLEGLQDAIVNVGKDLVVFNKDTGKMSIPPTAIRQIKEMSGALKMSQEEFSQMIRLQAKFDQVVNQLNFSSFTKEMEDSGVGEYISSIARMGQGGRYQVKVDGDMKFVDALTPEDMKALQEDALVDANTKAKTEKEIMVEQLTALDAINNSIKAFGAQGFASGLDVFSPADFGKELNKATTTGLESSLKEFGKKTAEEMTKGISYMFTGEPDSKIDFKKIGKEIAVGIGTGLKGTFKALSKALTYLGDDATNEIMKDLNLEGESEWIGDKGKKEGDFTVNQGQTRAVITSKGMIIPSKKDTLIGVDLSASPSMPNMGALNSTTPSNQTITLNTNKIKIDPIDLKLDGRNLGKMSGREIVDAIFANQTNAIILKQGLKSINPITASSGTNENNSPFD